MRTSAIHILYEPIYVIELKPLMKLAYIQTDDKSGNNFEMNMLRTELPKRGIAVEPFRKNEIFEEKIDLSSECIVAGDVEVITEAMRQMGIPIPVPNDYPKSLDKFLHRKIWTSRFSNLRQKFEEEWPDPVFAKPKTHRKLFRGRVFQTVFDFHKLNNIQDDTIIVCSEVIPIISEFRFYIVDSKIVAQENYDGDPQDMVDIAVVKEAVEKLEKSGESISAYAIDFGLLRTGETILIEMNDGFSIGTYCEIEPKIYTDFTLHRWEQLQRERTH